MFFLGFILVFHPSTETITSSFLLLFAITSSQALLDMVGDEQSTSVGGN